MRGAPAVPSRLAIGGLILVIAGLAAIGYVVDFRESVSPSRVADLLDGAGALAPLVLIGLLALAVVVSPIPSLPLDLAAGATFGPLLGTAYAVIGAELGAILSFLIGRALGRELIAKLLRRDVAFCERCSDRHLMLLVLVSRLVPVFSFDVVSYGAGLTNMSLPAFATATLVGMVPPTFALVYFGGALVSNQLPLVLAGGAMVAVFLLAPKLVLRHGGAWWAKLLLAAPPSERSATQEVPARAGEAARDRCAGCGGSLP